MREKVTAWQLSTTGNWQRHKNDMKTNRQQTNELQDAAKT